MRDRITVMEHLDLVKKQNKIEKMVRLHHIVTFTVRIYSNDGNQFRFALIPHSECCVPLKRERKTI